MGSLKDFGFQFEEVLDKDSIISGSSVYMVTGTRYNNPNPYLRNKDLILHTCILSQCGIGEQGRIMSQLWSTKGLVVHAFFFCSGDVLLWRDPRIEKGKIGGPYNSVSLQALVETDCHRCSKEQILSIKSWIQHCNDVDYSIKVINLLSHDEARESGRNGQIDNIDEMRRVMELGDSRI